MGIDMASVYAAKYRKTPDVLRAAVMGQSPDRSLDSYTALNALKLVKEADMMAMAGQAQQPTSAPSLVAQALAPPPMQQGLGAMVPGAMGGQGMPPQGMPPQGMPPQGMPQQTMQAASGGLAGMYSPEEDYAEGGIVAFQSGGLNSSGEGMESLAAKANPLASNTEGEGEERGVSLEDLMFTSKGDPETYAALAQQLPGAIQSMSNFEYEGLTPKGRRKVEMDEIAAFREAVGPNTAMDTLRADVNARKGERAGNLEEGKGVALLKAAAAMAQGNNWVRAFGNAGAAFGDEYNRALQADKLEKRSIAVAEFNIADAQRKENMGLFKEGRAAGDRAVVAQQTAEKARFEKTKAVADALTKGMTATKPLNSSFRTGAGGAGNKLPQVDRRAGEIAEQIVDLRAADPNDPKIPGLVIKLEELKKVMAANKEVGPNRLESQNAQIFANAADKATTSARKLRNQDTAYLTAMRNRDNAAANNRMREIYAEEIQKFFPNTPLSDLLAAAPPGDLTSASGGGGAPAPAASKPAAQKALPVPASKDDLKINQLYNTNQGLGIWNGKSFTAQ